MIDPNRLSRGLVNEIANGVWYVPALISNLYFVGERGGPWVMVDAGTPGTTLSIRLAAQRIFGDNRPSAIVLTHGHFDHVGALPTLADEWDVPVFAHNLEAPYLDGRADYPPPDPTVGGFMAQLSRFFPKKGINVGNRLRPLPSDGFFDQMPGWQVVHTPGHTAGHVSFYREADGTLLAGDAVITIDQQNPAKLFTQVREFHGPPQYFTPDWESAHDSIRKLSHLRPRTVATGHGLPVSGDHVPDMLSRLASKFSPPTHGRYVKEPARANEQGVIYVPPAPRDRAPLYAAGIAIGIGGILLANARRTKRAKPLSTRVKEVVRRKEPAGENAVIDRMSYDIFGRKT